MAFGSNHRIIAIHEHVHLWIDTRQIRGRVLLETGLVCWSYMYIWLTIRGPYFTMDTEVCCNQILYHRIYCIYGCEIKMISMSFTRYYCTLFHVYMVNESEFGLPYVSINVLATLAVTMGVGNHISSAIQGVKFDINLQTCSILYCTLFHVSWPMTLNLCMHVHMLH